MRRSRFCALVLSSATLVARPGRACDVCGLPTHTRHRIGAHRFILEATASRYASWHDVRIVVGIVNPGKTPLPIDTMTPIWKQSSLHIAAPWSSPGVSFPDVPILKRGNVWLAPGATYYFLEPDGGRSISIMRWDGPDHTLSGTYAVDVSYGEVDSQTVAFRIG